MPLMRLQKYLSAAGHCSRRKGEEIIQAGRVRVNGQVVCQLGAKVDSEKDRIDVDGLRLKLTDAAIYIALHKPPGYITSCEQGDERIVLDLIDIPERIYPVGRLDKDSSGLLLLTNDGKLHHKLSHPSFDHEKEYEVSVATPIPTGALKRMAQGMTMMGSKTRPAEISRISGRRFRMVLREGRNRQIRRMVRKIGNRVVSLKRLRIANIRLGRMSEGSWRHLTAAEKKELLKIL